MIYDPGSSRTRESSRNPKLLARIAPRTRSSANDVYRQRWTRLSTRASAYFSTVRDDIHIDKTDLSCLLFSFIKWNVPARRILSAARFNSFPTFQYRISDLSETLQSWLRFYALKFTSCDSKTNGGFCYRVASFICAKNILTFNVFLRDLLNVFYLKNRHYRSSELGETNISILYF